MNRAVAYKLQLPVEANVHLVFHVSRLKLYVGPVEKPTLLPLLTEEGVIVKEPVAVVDRCIGKKYGKAITKVFIQWKHTFLEDAT